MSKPQHQHYIPKSYLRNFAITQNNKLLIEAKRKEEKTPKKKLLSIRDICVNKNIYTLPKIEGNNKYSLEKYYAENVDSVYPEVYELLTNPKRIYITKKERIKIIMTTMSLFFRTPKFLNQNERHLNHLLELGSQKFKDKDGNIKFNYQNYKFDFHIDNLEEEKNKLKVENKIKFLSGHLDTWQKFIEFKINAEITVFRMYEDLDLITSDNPVTMHSVEGNPFNVFDPTNIISLPLDNKHYLTIFPNTVKAMKDRIFRGERDKWFGLTTNLSTDENSEEWILGKPNSVYKHIDDQVKYGAHTSENLQEIENMKEKVIDSQELVQIIERVGTIAHPLVANKIKELRKKSIHKNDPEIKKMILELAKHGFLTI